MFNHNKNSAEVREAMPKRQMIAYLLKNETEKEKEGKKAVPLWDFVSMVSFSIRNASRVHAVSKRLIEC